MAFGSLSHRTVIIHGKSLDGSNPLVHFPGAELWVVTNAVPRYWAGNLPGWTEAFNIHPDEYIDPQTLDWYRSLEDDGRPVWLQSKRADIRPSREFPMMALRDMFPSDPFGCTDDAVIAFAIARGATTIVLDGIGTTDDPLFQFLHRTVWNWIGRARGMGIEVIVREPSCFSIGKRKEIYGYDRLGHAEMRAFVAAWNDGTKAADWLSPLESLLHRLATTSTLSPIYASSVLESARAYFREGKRNDPV